MFRNNPLNLTYCTVLISTHAAAIAAFLFPFENRFWPLILGHYLWFGFASSLYYHRCLTHRSFELATPLQIFFLLGGLIGLGGDPIGWAAIHRFHHQNSDHETDIHSPRHGWMNAYFLWYMKSDPAQIEGLKRLTPDLEKIWFLKLAQGVLPTTVFHTIYATGIWLSFGWAGLFYGFYLPLALSYQFHVLLIALFCHVPAVGYRRFHTNDDSRNVWWLGPLSFGEAYHNAHHQNARRMPMAQHWAEIDLTKYTVWCLEKLGLAKKVIW